MTDTVTHVAAQPVTINGRTIQRCAVCGEKLIDNKNEMAPVEPGGAPPRVLTWEIHRLVQIRMSNPRRFLLLPKTDEIPDNSCIGLVE